MSSTSSPRPPAPDASDWGLLLDIFGCPEIPSGKADTAHPCHRIVTSQDGMFGSDHVWQPPTPWIGHLQSAPILFIGSNPSIGGKEHYPRDGWSTSDLVDFFDWAFDGHIGHIKDGIRALQADGTYGPWVRTWAGVKKRAEELLGPEAEPGLDYAMTELVHCRSQSENGLAEAMTMCAERYLERIFQLSPAVVVVGLGAKVRSWMVNRYELGHGSLHREVTMGGRQRSLVFIPHPTSFGPKKFAQVLQPDELDDLCRAVQRR